MIHAISTGKVKITRSWVKGKGDRARRLINTLTDREFTEWLPIWCYLIEDKNRLILVDTGISQATRHKRYFPPQNLLVQRAVEFKLQPEEEIGHQIRSSGYDPRDIETVILTHLHQDHDGGIHFFPNANFLVSRDEWEAAKGFAGRMAGYLNQFWPKSFSPELVDFSGKPFGEFSHSYPIDENLVLVPTPGHSPGQMSLIYDNQETRYFMIGDTAYSEDALTHEVTDGVTTDIPLAIRSMRQIRSAFAKDKKNIVLPSHDPDVVRRLE